jgi:hypothetical protein
MLAALLGTLVGCTTTATPAASNCVLPAPALVPASSEVGATAVLSAAGQTSANDTLVHVGSNVAEVVSVDRVDCDACDSCRTTNSCGTCSDCDACGADCLSCVETVSFLVPALAPGTYATVLRNLHGQYPAASLEIVAAGTGADSGADSGGVQP